MNPFDLLTKCPGAVPLFGYHRSALGFEVLNQIPFRVLMNISMRFCGRFEVLSPTPSLRFLRSALSWEFPLCWGLLRIWRRKPVFLRFWRLILQISSASTHGSHVLQFPGSPTEEIFCRGHSKLLQIGNGFALVFHMSKQLHVCWENILKLRTPHGFNAIWELSSLQRIP